MHASSYAMARWKCLSSFSCFIYKFTSHHLCNSNWGSSHLCRPVFISLCQLYLPNFFKILMAMPQRFRALPRAGLDISNRAAKQETLRCCEHDWLGNNICKPFDKITPHSNQYFDIRKMVDNTNWLWHSVSAFTHLYRDYCERGRNWFPNIIYNYV